MDKNFFKKSDIFSKNTNILITGGGGFIGGALIRKLLEKSECNIFNLDKLSYSSDLTSIKITLNKLNQNEIKRYKFLKVDLSKEEEVNKIVKDIDPDLILHLAAESHVDRSIDSPFQFISSNIIGTYYLLQSCLSHYEKLSNFRKEKFRFIHISTDEVFGSLNEEGFFCEKTKYDPRSPYSASKASSDHLVNAWHHTYGLPSIITNCTNNYGPWQFPEKLIPLVITRAMRQEDIPIFGTGKNIRDWLFVEDHINAILLATERGIIGKSYCIGANNERTNIEIVEMICEILDKQLPREKSHKDLIKFVKNRPGHDYRYAMNIDKIKNKIGWKPKVKFEVGINKTIKWYLKNLNWYENNLNYKGERLGLIK